MGEALPKKSSGKVRRNEHVICRFADFIAGKARMFASVAGINIRSLFIRRERSFPINLNKQNPKLMTGAIELGESYFTGVDKSDRENK